MIVPQTRLLIWTTFVVLPCSLLGSVFPETLFLMGGLVAIFILLSILDALLGLGAGEGIDFSFPEVTRFSKGREGKIEFYLRNTQQNKKTLRLGLPFPKEIFSEFEDKVVQLPSSQVNFKITWPCIPSERGLFVINRCYYEGFSPLGFWGIRNSGKIKSEIRVYPDLFSEKKYLSALFLNRGTLGVHTQRQVGKGREFEKLRDYLHGDSLDDIHWKATAKRNHPVTKVFQIEKTQEVYVVVDASRLTARKVVGLGEGKEKPLTHLERYLTTALILGLAAERQGDHFGIITFSDKVHKFIRAKNGKAHYSTIRDAIYTMEPHIVSPDFDELSSFIHLQLRRRALLIFLTHLDDPALAESFVNNVQLISRRHLILVGMLNSPGVAPLFSNEEVISSEEIYDHLGGHLLWQNLKEVEKKLKRNGVQMNLLDNEMMASELVSQYINIKQRQVL